MHAQAYHHGKILTMKFEREEIRGEDISINLSTFNGHRFSKIMQIGHSANSYLVSFVWQVYR